MKKTVRLLCTGLCLMFILSSLTGCVSNSTNKKDGDSQEKTKIDSTQTSSDLKSTDPLDKYAPKNDKIYNIKWAKKQQGGKQVVKEKADIVWYFEDMFNVKFDIQDYVDEKDLNLRIASGERYDFIETRSPEQYTKYVEEGMLLELTDDMFKRFAPNMWTSLNKEAPGFFDYGFIDGKRYSVGALSYLDEYHYPIVWRSDWLNNVGIKEPPKTLNEFEEAMYAFAKNDPDKNNKNDTYGMSNTSIQLILNYFGYSGYTYGQTIWHERNGELVWGAVQPELKEAVALLNKWYKDGVLDPEFITTENKGGYWALSHSFIEERIGLSCMGYSYHWTVPQKIEINSDGKPIMLPEGSSNFNELYNKKKDEALSMYTYGEPLIGSDGVQRARAVESTFWGVLYGISSDLEKKEPDKVGKILDIWQRINNTDFDTFMYSVLGKEGEDWFFNEYGAAQSTSSKDITALERGGNTLFHIAYNPSFWKKYLKVRYDYADDPKNKFTIGVMKNKFTWTVPSATKYKAELDKIQQESFIQIITGEKPVDYFDEYIKIWMSAGGEQYTKEVNDWYSKQPK